MPGGEPRNHRLLIGFNLRGGNSLNSQADGASLVVDFDFQPLKQIKTGTQTVPKQIDSNRWLFLDVSIPPIFIKF